LDRKVEGQTIAVLSKKDVYQGQSVYVIGHPLGLPLKVAPGGSVEDISKAYFTAKLNVFSGNSGSPVFDSVTHEVIGIVAHGDSVDFRPTKSGLVSAIYPNPDLSSNGSRCTRVSEFTDYLDFIFLEDELRRSVSRGLYPEGKKYLQKMKTLFPDRKDHLKEEFGFIYDFENPENDEMNWTEETIIIDWRRKVWKVLSKFNDFKFESVKKKSKPIKDRKLSESNYIRKGKSSVQMGDELEKPVLYLFDRFLNMCTEDFILEILKKRRQTVGSQYGYDLEFACQIKGNKDLKLRIECKNYQKKISLRHITEKIAMAKLNYSNDPIDHWILIAPFAKVTNDLNSCLNSWQNPGEYPFKIQVWDQDSGIDQFFGLVPEIYNVFFKPSKGQPHPRDWDTKTKQKVLESWKKRLHPTLHLRTEWEQYLKTPGKFLLQGDPTNLESLYENENHVALKCKDEKQAIIWGKTLEDVVIEWLNKPLNLSPTLILLGEFGDGKTVFSYILSRKIAEKFLESPSKNWLPIRFSLRDFSFDNVNTTRDFVRRRLEEFGADINGWDTLKKSEYKLLAILDGFDEISKKLDHKTILRSIKRIIECYQNEFSGMKLLITSRKHFFENQEHKDQLLQRIGNPKLIHIAPVDRKSAEDHLEKYSKIIHEEEKFNSLKKFYDPIELASKPLFLEMIKSTLKELPNDDLDELILYETYIQKSLDRKVDDLEDENLETSPKVIIENMKEILEKISIALHQADAEFVYLSEVHVSKEYLDRLWKMSNPEDCSHEDEVGRIAVRSLLKRINTASSEEGKQWPVDFCHRSMREYFVARAIFKMVGNNLEHARQFLRTCYLTYEIIFFTSKMMKKNSDFDYTGNLWKLIQETRGHNEKEKFKVGHLGSNAANLLFHYKEALPFNDWSYLALDGVDFSGADLSGKNFNHTTFHYANFNNADFSNADFSFCDLTGVKLEEISSVNAIAVTQDESIYALYDDGIIREWKYKSIRTPFPENLEESQKFNYNLLIAQPGNDLTAIDDRHLIFFDKDNIKLKHRAKIEINPSVTPIKASSDNLLLFTEVDDQNILHLVDLKNQSVIKSMETLPFSLCDHLGTSAFIIYNNSQGLQIVDITSQNRPTIVYSSSKKITCLAPAPALLIKFHIE